MDVKSYVSLVFNDHVLVFASDPSGDVQCGMNDSSTYLCSGQARSMLGVSSVEGTSP